MKNVTISDDLYENLVSMKMPGESFSNVITRLARRKKVRIDSFYGEFRGSKFLDELESEVKKNRKDSRSREFQ